MVELAGNVRSSSVYVIFSISVSIGFAYVQTRQGFNEEKSIQQPCQ